jgi:hypothetical protein
VSGEERLHLGLDRLHQHAPRTLAQHGQQRIGGDTGSWPGQWDNAILLHGVSFLVTSTITEDTPPPSSATKFGYSPEPPPPKWSTLSYGFGHSGRSPEVVLNPQADPVSAQLFGHVPAVYGSLGRIR